MIQYTLKCSQGHKFDSWFQSASAYDKLRSTGMVACAICGNSDVEKAIMTPRVRPARNAASASPAPEPSASLTATSPAERALSELRRKVEETSDYVGTDFATQARAMHDGEAPERPIYGEARADEARALIEDGVPVAPLPFTPSRKTN